MKAKEAREVANAANKITPELQQIFSLIKTSAEQGFYSVGYTPPISWDGTSYFKELKKTLIELEYNIGVDIWNVSKREKYIITW